MEDVIRPPVILSDGKTIRPDAFLVVTSGRLSEVRILQYGMDVIVEDGVILDNHPCGQWDYQYDINLSRLSGDVILPSKLFYIGGGEECGGCYAPWLRSIKLPMGLVSIGDHCFPWYDFSRADLRGSRVRILGVGAFRGCRSLQHLHVPDTLEEIGHMCFSESSLCVVDLSHCKNLRTISPEAFSGCGKLRGITLPVHGLAAGDSMVYGCDLLVEFDMGCVNPYGGEDSATQRWYNDWGRCEWNPKLVTIRAAESMHFGLMLPRLTRAADRLCAGAISASYALAWPLAPVA
jgi:hypothetical protein